MARLRRLQWIGPITLGLLVIAYQFISRALGGRPTSLAWFLAETLAFGVVGPAIAWWLLRRLRRDLDLRTQAERRLSELYERVHFLATVANDSADAIVGLDAQDIIRSWNRGAQAIFGYTPEEVLGQPFTILLPPTDEAAEEWDQVRSAVDQEGYIRNYETVRVAKDGRHIHVDLTYTLVRDTDGRVIGSSAVMRDISRRRAMQRQLQRRNRELMALYAVSAAINQAFDVDEALKRALDRLLEVLDLDGGRVYLWDADKEEMVLRVSHGMVAERPVLERVVKPGECLCGLAVVRDETMVVDNLQDDPRVSRSNCQMLGFQSCASVPLRGTDQLIGVMHLGAVKPGALRPDDFTMLSSLGRQMGVALENMRLREEARRAAALSTLIQEMHHRIKNNLQTVADLLSLEMSQSASPDARQSLRDSITRIKSIAAVHQLLSLEQLRLTDITELARQVCEISIQHLVHPGQRITAEVRGPSIYLPSKQATALALVMNELISNALEHAFVGLDRGALLVELAQDGNEVRVTIRDDGHGLSPGFDVQHSKGLGLQIAHTLVEKDLNGMLRFGSANGRGTEVQLVFYK
ncbi:MAG: MEKHLA domain-containing protein [Chloroflexi bacterium]|nr:MEKHLA domain-containing protein [Chloroflexota bacterium]